MRYPRAFVTGPGVTQAVFDYFPEEHYRQGFEALRGTMNDGALDRWMDEILHHRPVGTTHSGLWRDDVPQLVADILTSSHQYETEITIRPEDVSDSYDYVVEWQYIDFNQECQTWRPVLEIDLR